MLASLYDIKEPAIQFVTTTDRYNTARRLTAQGSNPVLEYPRMFLHVTNLTRGKPEDGYGNVRSKAKNGVFIKSGTDNQTAYKRMVLIPCVYSLELLYLDDNFLRALNFASQWLVHGINGRLNFTVNYYGMNVDIRSDLSEEVATPDRDETVDQVNHYEYMTTFTVRSWIDSVHKDDSADVPAIRSLRTEVSLLEKPAKDPFVYDAHRQCNSKTYGVK